MSVPLNEVENVIRKVFVDKPVGSFHETERLWEVLLLLGVVSDTETPDFFNDILSQESGQEEQSSTQETKQETKQEDNDNPFSSQFNAIRAGIRNLERFSRSEEAENILNILPAASRDNIKNSLKEISNDDPLSNPLMKMFNNLMGGGSSASSSSGSSSSASSSSQTQDQK
jgi:hypothetical protein